MKNQKFRYEERKSRKIPEKNSWKKNSQIQKITKENPIISETRRHIRIDQLLISLDHQTQNIVKFLALWGCL
jgi:hypothetical protein